MHNHQHNPSPEPIAHASINCFILNLQQLVLDLCWQIGHKHLFTKESIRDVADMLRSLYTWPFVVFYDDPCGVVTFMEGNYPAEARQLWSDRRGCFETWQRTAAEPKNFKIVELEDGYLHKVAYEHRGLTTPPTGSARAEMRRIFHAAGAARMERHPLMVGWTSRLVVQDRFHSLWGQKMPATPHKHPSCTRHNVAWCPSLSDTKTNMMESLNKQANKRKSVLCHQDVEHHIYFCGRMEKWSNQSIAEEQLKKMMREARTTERVCYDEDWHIAYLCDEPDGDPGGCNPGGAGGNEGGDAGGGNPCGGGTSATDHHTEQAAAEQAAAEQAAAEQAAAEQAATLLTHPDSS
jgi:hypothetical protein